jgi:pSer/pThr/pTyr-binding forkhead associated (FHA) protein
MELLLWIVRFTMLALMILLLLFVAMALRADLRAGGAPPREPEPNKPTPPEPTPRPMPPAVRRIVHLTGPPPANGREFPLVGEVLIGRDPACQIVIPNTVTSKRHARVYPQDGGWHVADTGSTNGTLHNGAPLLDPARLAPGDRLRIGETEFELR